MPNALLILLLMHIDTFNKAVFCSIFFAILFTRHARRHMICAGANFKEMQLFLNGNWLGSMCLIFLFPLPCLHSVDLITSSMNEHFLKKEKMSYCHLDISSMLLLKVQKWTAALSSCSTSSLIAHPWIMQR